LSKSTQQASKQALSVVLGSNAALGSPVISWAGGGRRPLRLGRLLYSRFLLPLARGRCTFPHIPISASTSSVTSDRGLLQQVKPDGCLYLRSPIEAASTEGLGEILPAPCRWIRTPRRRAATTGASARSRGTVTTPFRSFPSHFCFCFRFACFLLLLRLYCWIW
jgi:hypothetical protein